MAAIYHIEDWEMAMLWGPMSIVRGQHIKKYDMILRLGDIIDIAQSIFIEGLQALEIN